jgi:serine/threonine-protein kinase
MSGKFDPPAPKTRSSSGAIDVTADTQEPDRPATHDSAFDLLLSQVARPPHLGSMQPGARVGEYRIIKSLGKGTFGTVYHAAHEVIGKQAALKVLNAQFSGDSRIADRFIDEARAVNRIAHPNIVDIFGFGELPDGRKYCVMELLEGETLASLLASNAPCPLRLALDILTQIAAALDAAHDHQIVHRDLKPDNVFVASKGGSRDGTAVHVKLLDFGIARIGDRSAGAVGTASGMVLGTPAYMSPEQCRGDRVDRRTDVYALGVVAFEMLTGQLPFRGENLLRLVSQHINEAPPIPTDVNPALPDGVNGALLRMLAKSPQERPERASEGVHALLVALGQEQPSGREMAPPSEPAPPGAPPRVGRRGVAAIVAGVLALLALLGLRAAPRLAATPAPSARVDVPAVPAPSEHEPVVSTPVSPPAEAPSVRVRLTGTPETAQVWRGKEPISTLGEAFRLPRSSEPVVLRITANGFVDQELQVVPTQDVERDVRLTRKQGVAGSRSGVAHELEY